MVMVGEAVRLDKVRLFRWNEKFMENKFIDSQGLALFVISSEFGISNDHNRSKTIHKRCKIVVPLNLSDLLLKNKDLGLNLVRATGQFLSVVVPELGEQISSYLFTRFKLDHEFLFRLNSPKTIIVIEVARERMIQGLDEDDIGNWEVSSIVPLDRPPHYRYRYLTSAADDNFEDEEDEDEDEDKNKDENENESDSEDKQERRNKDETDINEYLLELKGYLVEDPGTWQKSRPITRDEPRGFVEIPPIRLGKRKEEFDKTVDKCAICLDGFLGADDDQIATTACLHVFHRHCISKWLIENNSCPSCRLLVPLL